ncbi:esterase, PHB depolymerase family [Sulfitobacter brevis]|uniref:Esterase, PHB depolymerase family n=1 Tax=Sulfitobacter brevis TaxID=74348 RepID=A0A1I2HB78_9RHOB|nr:PHB depolymerase family esterase [Sulfitobacter brevis]SFF26779.1 esterase, PHB depolymerase family [Sulfitobacter brevis]
MFDPFKRARSKAAGKARRATVKAMTNAWGTMLAPTKPVKPKVQKKPEPAAPERKGAFRRDRSTVESKIPRTAKSTMSVPRGASFSEATYESEFGTRSYMLYVPKIAKVADDPLPLIVMLHGCGQTPKDFARGTGMNALAEELGFLVLFPAQARDAHHQRCWNWYHRGDQARGAGEPALLAGLTHHIIDNEQVDPAKVYVAGLSAGAAAALILATAYPDIFAAVGVHSGLAVGAAHDKSTAPRAMQLGDPGQRHDAPIPSIIFHGNADKVVNPRNGRFVAIRAVEPFGSLEMSEESGRIPDGREYIRTVHRIGKGRPLVELWVVQGAGHAWSGGHAAGSYTDPKGPDASREIARFFLRHRTTKKRRRAH